MQKLVFIILGLALLGFGSYREFATPSVSDADRARCEQIVRDQNGGNAEVLDTLLPKCTDPGMVAMMDAQASGDDAQAAARRISAANQGDAKFNVLNWMLIGAGLGALAGGFQIGRRRA